MSKICSKLTIKTSNDVNDVVLMFFFNFQQILHFIPTFPSSILNKQIPAEKF